MNRWNVTLFLVSAALALGLPVAAMAAADLTIQLSRIGAGPVFTGNQDQSAIQRSLVVRCRRRTRTSATTDLR